MVRYARMVPKIDVDSLFGPNFLVEFAAFVQKIFGQPYYTTEFKLGPSKSQLLTHSSIHFSDQLETPQLLGPKEEVASASAGPEQSINFNCAVRSSGPTQVQWLRQLRDDQQPRNNNKTVVVFDYVFEVGYFFHFHFISK